MIKPVPLVYAIIPARAGSKGVPKKNVKLLGKHPLIAYSIVAAKHCPNINRVIVSTNSEEIALISKKYGAEVPFIRPDEYAQDHSPDIDFIKHALDWFELHDKKSPDFLVHLRPTTPLRDPKIITAAINAIQHNIQATSLRSGQELPEPPQKMFGIEDGFFKGLYPNDPRPEYYNLPRQTFPPVYHPNGYVDIIRSDFVKKNDSLHGSKILAFITSTAIEIDRPEDFDNLESTIDRNGNPLDIYLNEYYSQFTTIEVN